MTLEKQAALTERIRALHARSRGTYGAVRIHADLAAEGWQVGRKRVARLMRSAGLRAVSRRRFAVTTQLDLRVRPAPDRVERSFTADAPGRLYVGDITYIPTSEGFLYLAMVLEALEMALAQRQPEAVIHDSDQGCQYTSLTFTERCREAGVAVSRGDCYDNAMAESFFATLECEVIQPRRFQTRSEARQAVFSFI